MFSNSGISQRAGRYPHGSTLLVDVEYVGKMEAVVFRLGDGRILGVPLCQIEGGDATPVTKVSLIYDGDAVFVERFSGNRVEVSWDQLLQLADPTSVREPASRFPTSRVGDRRRPAGARSPARRRGSRRTGETALPAHLSHS